MLSRGNSFLLGGAKPVTTIKWIGGHRSLIAAANRSPSVAITLCPPLSRIARKYSLKINIKSKQLFENFIPDWSLLRVCSEFIVSRSWQRKSPAFIDAGLYKRLEGCVAERGGSASGSLGVLIDLGFRKLREGVVGLLFLGERCFQQLHSLI